MAAKSSKLVHIHKKLLPDRIQLAIEKKGFSIYRNVLVVWDSVPNKKLLEFVDSLLDKHPEGLLVVYFEDNLLEVIWQDVVPADVQYQIVDTESGRIEMVPSVYVIPVIYN